MNISFKRLSLNIIILPLVTSMNTQCMQIKNLKKINPLVITPRHYSSEKNNDKLTDFYKHPPTLRWSKKIVRKFSKKESKKIIKRLLKSYAYYRFDNDFGNASCSRNTKRSKVEEISVEDFLRGLLKKRHKAHLDDNNE